MSSLSQDWYRCSIDRKRLKELSKRNDRTPLLWFGSYLALIIACGIGVVMTWNTPWVWAWLAGYSFLWGLTSSAVHELSHGTPFRSRWLNETWMWIFSWMAQFEPVSVRWAHAGHHSNTHHDEGDPELSEPNPVSWFTFFNVGLGLWAAVFYWRTLLRMAFNSFDESLLRVIPEGEVPKAVRNARIIVGSYLAIVLWSVVAASWLPIVLFLAPRVLGGPVTGFLHLTQHTGLKMNIRDHRHSTRSFSANPLTRYCYFNMNHHIEHHMFPMVPFYNLPKLTVELASQMPEPNRGLLGVYSEILRTIVRQHREPGYYHAKQVPGDEVVAKAA